jgi:hypothetical protein
MSTKQLYEVSVYHRWPVERFWYAGLSIDGNQCFLTDIDEYGCIVFDTKSHEYLWED